MLDSLSDTKQIVNLSVCCGIPDDDRGFTCLRRRGSFIAHCSNGLKRPQKLQRLTAARLEPSWPDAIKVPVGDKTTELIVSS